MVKQIQACNTDMTYSPMPLKPVIKPKGLLVDQWTKEQIIEAFKSHDANGDGKLSKAELRQAFKYLGSNWGGRRASKAMSYADADGSGFIEITDTEFDELVEYALQLGYKVR